MKKFKIFVPLIIIALCLSACLQPEKPRDELPEKNNSTGSQLAQSEYNDNESISSNNNIIYEEAIADLDEINKLRPDYNLGTCRNLKGDVAVALFFMEDFESEWTSEEMTKFTDNEIKPGLEFLEKQAERYGVDLKLSIKCVTTSVPYNGEVITDSKKEGEGTVDALEQAANYLDYSSAKEMIQSFKAKYGEEVVYYTIFNKSGISYAINPPRGMESDVDEHCISFTYSDGPKEKDEGAQASVIASRMLYLYGAERYSTSPSRKGMAKWFYRNDIILNQNYYIKTNDVCEVTAFYIGWTDKVPDIMYNNGW